MAKIINQDEHMIEFDVFFNSSLVGIINANENSTQAEISKKAQTFLPRRSMNIKEIFISNKSISLIEKH